MRHTIESIRMLYEACGRQQPENKVPMKDSESQTTPLFKPVTGAKQTLKVKPSRKKNLSTDRLKTVGTKSN